MERMIGNAFLCLKKDCSHKTTLVQNMNEMIQKHPQHQFEKIENLKNQLNIPQHPLNKFQQINRQKIVFDIDAKIQEITTFSNELITQFEHQMRKIAIDTIELFDNQNYLINAVKNLQAQIIGENSKAISKLFCLDQKEIESQVNQATKMKIDVDEQINKLKEQMRKLFQHIIPENNGQSIIPQNNGQVEQIFKWSQVMKNKVIKIKDKTAVGERNGDHQLILMEPRIDFNSTQSCRVKLNIGLLFSYGWIILGDYNIIKLNNPEFIRQNNRQCKDNEYGTYNIYSNGDVIHEGTNLPNKSFQFYSKDLIEIIWDGSRRVFGIKKIGTEEKYLQFEMKVQFTENSELYFGVGLYASDCSIE